jgi:hypothetical protein
MTFFLWSLTGTAALFAGIFFLKFWRETRDAFFLWFALAFGVFAAHWFVQALGLAEEHAAYSFAARLVAFLLIALAIVKKNRE